MRERFAIGVGALALLAVVSLSVLFARAQNPGDVGALREAGYASAPASGPALGADSIRGRAVYDALGCASCHSVAGVGNPRNPLDGVGARRTSDALRDWALGAAPLADSLPPATFRAKQAFSAIPAEDLEALVAFLVSLAGGG